MDARDRLRALLEIGPEGASHAPEPAPDPARTVLEAGRWMTESLDVAMIRAIAVSTAVELLGADEGAYARGDVDGARWTPSPPTWAPPAPTSDPVVGDALASGTVQVGVVADGGRHRTTAATPVRAAGAVIGAIVVVREGLVPFPDDTADRLGLLSPLVGSAMEAADTLMGAVRDAEIDALTGLRNRRRLEADLSATPSGEPVAFAMLDVDHFKSFNDTHGHEAGDVALQMVAAAVAGAVRPDDVAYRYGGEEFSVLLRDCSGDDAMAVLERVRIAVRNLTVPGRETQPLGCVTVSIGLTVGSGGDRDLVGRADAALYVAKDEGRDRVVPAAPPP